MSTSRPLHALILASASLLAAATASAQTAPAETQVADKDASPDAIVVTGRRFSDTARGQQKSAINLVNVQSAEDIAKYPDFNAAEALSRIPGVSVSSDTGEGRFINIRGIDGNLNGTTFGGVQLLNTQPGGTSFGGGGRAVELDTIPIGAVDQLIVRKTGMPDQEAEGLGGSVDIIPRTAQGIKKPFLEGELGGGYEPLHGHAGIYRASIAAGYRFGPDDAFGIEANASYHEDGRAVDDVEPAFQDFGLDGNPLPGGRNNKVLSSVDLRRYNYNRRRFGFGSELTYDPTPQSHFYIRADDAGYTERVNRQVLIYSNLNADLAGNILTPDTNGTFFAPAATAALTLRDEQETHLNFVTAFGGHNDFGRVILDYQGSYTAASYHKDYDYGSTFSPAIASFPLSYNNSTITGLPAITLPAGSFAPSDPSQYTLSGFRNQTEGAHDREWAGRIDITIPINLIGTDEMIKFGGKLRLRDKRDNVVNIRYANVADAAIPLNSVLGPGPYGNFYRGQYDIGYAPNYLALRTLIPHQPNNFPASLVQRPFRPIFNDTENVYSGYIETQGKINKFAYLVGVRVENTDSNYRIPTRDGNTGEYIFNGTSPVYESGPRNYTDFFPTVQLRYDASSKLVARATYSTGIGRPGFEQVIGGAPTVDVNNRIISVGNPSLKPTKVNAFDIGVEYYLPHAGILSFGAFDKEFKDYVINTVSTAPSSPLIPGPGAVHFSGYQNISDSYDRGVEAEYTQKFTFLPAPFDGFGVDGNVTYADSGIQLHSGPKSRLPGTSTLTWNLAGFYEAHGAQIRLAANWVGPSTFGVNTGVNVTDATGAITAFNLPGYDTIQDTKFQVDLTSSYALTKQVRVYFNARNLFNGPLRYYEGYSNRAIQREFYDQTYEAGVKFAF